LLLVSLCASSRAVADDAGAPAPPDAKQACISAVEQGQTERDDGKYRQARLSFLACAQDSCPRVIQQSCTKWLRELDESAPTIVLAAKDDQGNDLTDVNVSFDGAPFVTLLDGKPVEVDVGEHVIRFDREGSAPVEQKLLLRAGEKARVVSVVLRRTGASTDADAGEVVPPPPEPTLSAHHVVSASVGLGALAAAGTGIYFLLRSNHERSTADGLRTGALASSSACSNPAASVAASCRSLHNTVESQHTEMNVATGLFIGAGALAASAVATWILWPKAHSSEPQTTGSVVPLPGGAALQISGRF
jgi:hypothetical protein